MTNAETMIATTFHRRIREVLYLQLLMSRINNEVDLNNKADKQLSSKLSVAICKKEELLTLPSELDRRVAQELSDFFRKLATAMKPLQEIKTKKGKK